MQWAFRWFLRLANPLKTLKLDGDASGHPATGHRIVLVPDWIIGPYDDWLVVTSETGAMAPAPLVEPPSGAKESLSNPSCSIRPVSYHSS